MSDDSFVMEMCGNKSAWHSGYGTKKSTSKGGKIESAGYTVGIRTRLATFSGPAELTPYPSGKLLVKTEDKDLAAKIAKEHVEIWVRA